MTMTMLTILSWSSCVEVKNLLGLEKEKTEERMRNSLRQFVEGWYGVENKDIIFDKSRGWGLNHLALQNLLWDISKNENINYRA